MSKFKGVVLHHEAEVAELRADRDLAVEFLKAAMESQGAPNDRAASLLALRTVAEAYGGLGQLKSFMTPKRVEFVLKAHAARAAMLATGKGYDVAEVHAYLAAQIAGRRPAKPKQKSWRR